MIPYSSLASPTSDAVIIAPIENSGIHFLRDR